MSGSLVLTGYSITEQSWLFLFNVGSGVHLQLVGQQWTGADFDWNIITMDKKNGRKPSKITKITKFQEYLEIWGKFLKSISWKYIKICISRKKILSVYSAFYFIEKLCILLKVKVLYYWHHVWVIRKIFGQFLPHLAHVFNKI